MTRRHLAAGAVMAAMGAATFGIGAVGSWLYAGYGIVEGGNASRNRPARFEHLIRQFPILRDVLLDGNDDDHDGNANDSAEGSEQAP